MMEVQLGRPMFGLLEKGGGEKRWDLDCGSVVRRGEGVLVQWIRFLLRLIPRHIDVFDSVVTVIIEYPCTGCIFLFLSVCC